MKAFDGKELNDIDFDLTEEPYVERETRIGMVVYRDLWKASGVIHKAGCEDQDCTVYFEESEDYDPEVQNEDEICDWNSPVLITVDEEE